MTSIASSSAVPANLLRLDKLGVGVLARMDQHRLTTRTQGGHASCRLDKLRARARDNGPIQAQCAISVRGMGVYIVMFSSRGGE